MAEKKQILVTDDEKSIRNTLCEILEYEEYSVTEAANGAEALELLERESFDLVLLDIKMPGMDGMEILEQIMEQQYPPNVIMLSGHGTVETAVKATQLGAYDFLEKPPDLNRLLISVRNALAQEQLQRENRTIKKKIPKLPKIIGRSEAVSKIRETVEKVAPTDARVLITGENGTGKELVAQWVHQLSRRCGGPFIDVNCAAIPADLLESELFGHEKGAFTGANDQRIGKFELADGGTLFLDEIGDMSMDAQAKVLRALQENKIMRVGGTQSIPINVRVVAATNKDLQDAIEEGGFREDLYHRVNVIPIHVAPLRKRRDDIPLLANHFLAELAEREIIFSGKELSDSALDALKQMDWSGNVRELRNVIERAAILTSDATIEAEDVQNLANTPRKNGAVTDLLDQFDSFQDFKAAAERLFLIHKLEENDWNISQTSDKIDIQRSHLYTKINKYNIKQ